MKKLTICSLMLSVLCTMLATTVRNFIKVNNAVFVLTNTYETGKMKLTRIKP